MKITIDNKEIEITDSTKNIVQVAEDHGITITAPCFRNKMKYGCCGACVVEINGEQKYACTTKAEDGMNITYHRTDLDKLRKEKLQKYADNFKAGTYDANECECVCGSSDTNCSSSDTDCCSSDSGKDSGCDCGSCC